MSSPQWNRHKDTFFSGVAKVASDRMMVIDLGPADLLLERVAESPVACGIHNVARLTTVGIAVLNVLRGNERVASAHDVIVKAEARARA